MMLQSASLRVPYTPVKWPGPFSGAMLSIHPKHKLMSKLLWGLAAQALQDPLGRTDRHSCWVGGMLLHGM